MSKSKECRMMYVGDDLMEQAITDIIKQKYGGTEERYDLPNYADEIKVTYTNKHGIVDVGYLNAQEVCDWLVEASVLKQEYKKFYLRVLGNQVELWATPKTIAEKKKHYTAKITKDLAREIDDVQEVYHYGKVKYPEDKWRKQDTEVHIQHAIDHLISYALGHKYDESHISNLAHAACRILFALHTAEDDAYTHCDSKVCEQCSCYRRNTSSCYKTKQPVYMPCDGKICDDFAYSDAFTAFVDAEYKDKGFDKEKLGMLKRAMKAREVMGV